MAHHTKKPRRRATGIYVNGRFIGSVRGGVFVKRVRASKHFLVSPPAIGFSDASIDAAMRAGASMLQILDTESGAVYSASLEHFEVLGFVVQRAGFEPQHALPLEHWTKGPAGERRRSASIAPRAQLVPTVPEKEPAPEPTAAPEPEQMGLF